MRFTSLFLILVAFAGVKADVESDLNRCLEMVNTEDLEAAGTFAGEAELNLVCPIMTGFLGCIADVVRDATGFELEDMAEFMKGTEVGKGVNFLVNLKNLFKDLCTEGSELREAYLQDAECYDKIEDDVKHTCKAEAVAAYQAYEEFENSIQEAAGENTRKDNEECMKKAYEISCIAVIIHDECGEHAFNTFRGIVRRSGFFRSGLCSEEGLETLKTTFVDNLEMDSSRKDLFRLAFEFKKRRK